MNSVTKLRAVHAVKTNSRELAVLCLMAILVGGIVAFTGVGTAPVGGTPLSESPDDPTTHSASVSQSVSVEVVNETEAFEAGETLTDRSLYPQENTSDPTVTASADAQRATLTELAITVRYEAAPRTDTGTPFYTSTDTVAAESVNGSQATLEGAFPIGDVLDRKAALENEFGPGTTVTVSVRSAATYQFEDSSGAMTQSTVRAGDTLAVVGNMYALPSESSRQIERTGETPATESEPSSWLNGLAVVLILLGGAGAVTTYLVEQRADPARLERAIQRLRFQEWITDIDSYTTQGNTNVVEVDSLPGLVDLAIDTRRRVLYHRPVNEYIVVDGKTVFKHVPESDSPDTADDAVGQSPGELEAPPSPSPRATERRADDE